MLSVICVYNRAEVLAEALLASLENQDTPHERILLDNTDNQLFTCAATGLNHGAAKATGDYLVFVQQDVALSGADWLRRAEAMVSQIDELGVAGLAGKRLGDYLVRSNIDHDVPPEPAGQIPVGLDPEPVQTVDELLFIVPRKQWQQRPLDEQTCNDWHLYAVDYCLSVAPQRSVVVLPLHVHHLSPGHSMSPSYYHTLAKVMAKHRGRVSRIHTTLDNWFPRVPLWLQRTWKRAAKAVVGNRGAT